MNEESFPPTQLLTDRDVATITGLARSTLAKLRLSGGGPRFIKISSSVRYPEDALTAWIAAHPRRTTTSDSDVEA